MKATAIPPQEQKDILAGLVHQHLERCNNDKAAAIRGAVNQLLEDEPLLEDVLQQVVTKAVDLFLRLDYKDQRNRAVRTALGIAQHAKAKAAERVAALYDFPMRSGTPLARAKKPEIAETAAHYIRQGTVHIQRGLWLQAVAARLPNDKTTVASVLKPGALMKLFEAAEAEVTSMGLPYER